MPTAETILQINVQAVRDSSWEEGGAKWHSLLIQP